MKYRKLRIAWSMACGVLCLLLIALWVRSFRRADLIRWGTSIAPVEVISVQGRAKITISKLPLAGMQVRSFSPGDPETETLADHIRGFSNTWGFGVRRGEVPAILLPYWFPVLLLATLGLTAWLNGQYRLRTLLVVITLISLLLGVMFGR